jgi:hypothetical protein
MANEFIARNGLIAQNNSTVTGSLIVTQGITGSLLGTASYATQALTASYASTYAPVFPFTGSAIITGSLGVTGSISNTTSVTTPIVNLTNTNNFLSGGGNTATLQALYQIQLRSSLNLMAEFNVASVNQINFTPYAGAGSARQDFTFIAAAHTNQTLSTNIPNFRVTGANKQWATGTLANQYFNYFTANTASFVGASTATNVYGLFVEAAAAGTNATITNNYAAGFSGRVGQYGLGNSTYFGDLCGVKDDLASRQNTAFGFSAANKVAGGSLNVAMGYLSLFSNISGNNNVAIGGLTLYQATSNSNIAVGGYALYNLTTGQSNVALGYDAGGGVTIGSNNVFIGNSITGLSSSLSNNIILATNLGVERFRYNPSQGSPSLFSFSPASTTGNVSSTEINIFRVNAATTTLIAGTLATQRFTYLPSQTLAFAGASTATNVYGLFVEAATAGTNATITNNYAAGFGGNILINTGAGSGRIRSGEYFSNLGALYFNQTSPDGGNYSISGIDNVSTLINGKTTVNIRINGTDSFNVTSTVITYKDAFNIAFGTTTGTKIGTTIAQKIAFWNATPIVQPTASTAIDTLLTNTGLRASGGGANFNTPITASIISASAFTGSLFGTASYATQALTASYASTYAPIFPFTGSAIITGSLEVTGSITSTLGFTGSLQGTSSWASDSISASYASTASYINGSIIKSNSVPPGMFGGTPLTTSITFTADFPNPSYSVTITGEDARIFTIQNKSATGFEINTNSNIALTGNTYWYAIFINI